MSVVNADCPYCAQDLRKRRPKRKRTSGGFLSNDVHLICPRCAGRLIVRKHPAERAAFSLKTLMLNHGFLLFCVVARWIFPVRFLIPILLGSLLIVLAENFRIFWRMQRAIPEGWAQYEKFELISSVQAFPAQKNMQHIEKSGC